MVFKNSINNIIRSKVKSLLFFLLILFLTVILGLGFSVWTSIDQFLEECDEKYTTIGLFEYMAPEYPDDSIYSEGMRDTIDSFDFSLISNNENVQLWDRTSKALGNIDGYIRTDTSMPYRDYCVLVIDTVEPYSVNGKGIGVVIEAPYAYRNLIGKAIVLERVDYDFSSDRTYVIHGKFTTASFLLTPYTLNGEEGSLENTVADITNEDGSYTIDEKFLDMAKKYAIINNSVTVYDTSNIEANYYFQQEQLYVKKGRSFSKEEYDNQDKVAIITEAIADKVSVDIGDKISLSMAIAKDTAIYESYNDDTGFTYSDQYTVVGIMNAPIGMLNYVFIPKNNNVDFLVNQVGYTIGQAVLNNDSADDFYEEIMPLLPNRVKLTIYDQGYKGVAKPLKDILKIAIIVTLLCMLVCLVVLILFGFLFVYRQREVSEIMMLLGAGKRKTISYFLLSSSILSFSAIGVGVFVSSLLAKYITSTVNTIAMNYKFSNTHYSSSSLTIIKEAIFNPNINFNVFLLTGLIVFLVAIFFCLLFTLHTFKSKNKKTEKVVIRKPRRSSKIPGGPFKFAALSISRGGLRTLVVPLVSMIIVIFLSQLATTANNYEMQLDNIYKETEITGQFTDSKGKFEKNIVMEAYQLNELSKNEFISEISVSDAKEMYYLGRSVINGEKQSVPLFAPPTSGFAEINFFDAIGSGPRLIFTNDLHSVPEFFHSISVVTTYLDGYDENSLGGTLGDIPLCMVTTDFMKEKGIELGDTISVEMIVRKPYPQDFLVIGSFEKQGSKDHIYTQLALLLDPEILFSEATEVEIINFVYKYNRASFIASDVSKIEAFKKRIIEEGYLEENIKSQITTLDLKEILFDYTFDSASFKVSDVSKLEEFKDYLFNEGYSEANRISQIRTFIVFEDKDFINTVDHLNQQIRYINILYPFLYVLIGVLGIVVSYLVVVSRRKEFAIMRGLGASRLTTFFSFFIEQITLCIIGCGVGIIGSLLLFEQLMQLQLLLVSGFAVCYFIGCAISITIMNSEAVLQILKEED